MAILPKSQSKGFLFLRGLLSAGFLFSARAVAVIYQLRYAEHAFGPSYGGLIALLNQVTFYILLAEMGLAAATTSLLFEPVHRKDLVWVKALMASMSSDVRKILLLLGPCSVAMSFVLAFWLRKQVPFKVALISVLLTSVAALLTFSALPYQSHFNANDRVSTRNIVLGFGFAGKVSLGVVLARVTHSFFGLPLGVAIVGVFELLIQRYLVNSRLGDDVITPQLIAEAHKAIRHRAKFVLAHRIGSLFGYQSDYIILLMSSSLALLGYYAHYQYIYAGILSFTLAVGGTVTARIARRQIGIGQEGYAALYRKTSYLITGGAVVSGSAFYLLAGPVVHLLYRNKTADPLAVLLFSILLMLNIYKMNDDLWIDTTGTYHKGYLLPLFEAASYVTLGLLLVRDLHMSGILYAGIITNAVFSVIFKSVVIGSGVMRNQVVSIVWIKLLNLALIGAIFYCVVRLAQMFQGMHAI